MRTVAGAPLGDAELSRLDAYVRAANYLSVGQVYLMDNPLLRQPLRPDHVKPRLLGHWGTVPGLNLIYAHLNRLIATHRRPVLYICGPGHGGPAMVANVWLEGTYSEVYPAVSRDERGMCRLFRQFSFPGGVPSHVAPETPGSIHEGGELGYSLAHAFGAAFDNPDLIVACVVGDGEAETGALAASWHSNKFLDPARDGAVLPILHLNEYKIANPTILARISDEELEALLTGYGWRPYLVAGDEPAVVHQRLAATLDTVLAEIDAIQARARVEDAQARTEGADQPAGPGTAQPGPRPAWPMIVLRTPKGWTGPSWVDGHRVEGTWRSHQVPLDDVRTDPEHLAQLEAWLRSYRPEELFDEAGAPRPEVVGWLPTGDLRMGATPYANGGRLTRPLELPDFRAYAVKVDAPGTTTAEPTRVLGDYLADVLRANAAHRNIRIVGPDETESNRLGAVLTATDKAWQANLSDVDEHLGAHGRVMEILSEQVCQGWLEGYLLTGRHGLFACYEAFAHIVDSMVNQHAKWLKTSRELSWRLPIPSLNYLLTSHVWRQDHNGFSHQDPGFIDLIVNKKGNVVRVYLPPDANTLLSVTDHCLRSRDYINVIVAGKQPGPSWLDIEAANLHCARGIGIWEWASTDHAEPDVVLACAGDPGRRRPAAHPPARPAGAGGQRGRPHAAALPQRAPARPLRRRVRRDLHHRQADHLRLPRLPVADPPADLPSHRARQPARARLQGGGHHHDPVRHGRPQRHGPLPPRHGRHRPRARAGPPGRDRPPDDGRPAHPPPRVHSPHRRGPPRGSRVDLVRRWSGLAMKIGER